MEVILADESRFYLRAFIEIYRVARFDQSGKITGKYRPALEGETVREAVRSLAKTHVDCFGKSPFHRQVDRSFGLFPELERQLSAMEKLSPNKKVQKAITPDFLRCMSSLSSMMVINDAEDHAIDLIIFAFFFAMRSCEFVTASPPGKTKTLTLGCITFWTEDRKLVHHDDPQLYCVVVYVRVVFLDQKNGEQFETRSQKRTNDPALCPVVRAARAVRRVRNFVPDCDNSTLLCATHGTSNRAKSLNQDFTLRLIKKTCTNFGGKDRFGFDGNEIGNKSIRCGAAMALFLTGHSSDKIMILGR